jgi:hypothetical protein
VAVVVITVSVIWEEFIRQSYVSTDYVNINFVGHRSNLKIHIVAVVSNVWLINSINKNYSIVYRLSLNKIS